MPTDDELIAELKEWQNLVDPQQVLNTFGDVSNQVSKAIAELESRFESTLERTQVEIDALQETAVDFIDRLAERIPEFLSDVAELLKSCFDRLSTLVLEDLIDKIVARIEETLTNIKEKTEATGEQILARFEAMIKAAKENVDKAIQSLNTSADLWRTAVSGTKEKFDGLVNTVGEIEEDIKALLRAMDYAMESTGTALSSASSALADIKYVLEEVV